MIIEGVYKNAAIVTNSKYCATVGRDILKKGGSCVDAAIACLLCEGILALHNSGVGGGFMMTIYKRNEAKTYIVDARECAPLAAHSDMFRISPESTVKGMAAVGVPGELLGYWEAHKRFGKLTWKELFEPSINFALKGFLVSPRLGNSFKTFEQQILDSPSLKKILAPEGQIPKTDEVLTLPILGNTLQTVSSSCKGALELYQGSLTQAFISDMKKYGGIITQEDFSSYKVRWLDEVFCEISGGLTVHSVPCPGSGLVLALILKLMDTLIQDYKPSDQQKLFVETLKHAYALRTRLGDPQFTDVRSVVEEVNSEEYLKEVKEKISLLMECNSTSCATEWYGGHYYTPDDKGTVSLSLVSSDGDAVVATSTINMLFGGLVGSPETGIILNSEMDDFSHPGLTNSFSVPPSLANMMLPGKRPLSSMCPTVVTDQHGDVVMAVGAAGGTHITSSVSQVIMNYFWLGYSLKKSIEYPRLHHQLLPMILKYEKTFPKDYISEMKRMGHNMKEIKPHSAVVAIARHKGVLSALYDPRRGGSYDGF